MRPPQQRVAEATLSLAGPRGLAPARASRRAGLWALVDAMRAGGAGRARGVGPWGSAPVRRPSDARPAPRPVAGIARQPRKVTKAMNKKQINRRSTLKTFVKRVNYAHMMPTRYSSDLDLKRLIDETQLDNPAKRKEMRLGVKKVFEERCVALWRDVGNPACVPIDRSLTPTASRPALTATATRARPRARRPSRGTRSCSRGSASKRAPHLPQTPRVDLQCTHRHTPHQQ